MEVRSRSVSLAAAVLLLMSALAPASLARAEKEQRAEDGGTDLVWPLPPDPPRIRYVGQLRGSGDFKRRQSRWKRFLLGPDRKREIALVKPYGVTTDDAGRVYVTDTGRGAVLVFDRPARKLRVLGRKGRVRLITPIGVAVAEDGRLYVSDADLDRIVVFDPKGNVEQVLGAAEGLANPAGIALDRARGRLIVADSHLHALFLYSTDGTFLGRWGTRGSANGQFNFPTNVAVDHDGRVYVVDTGNFRVQVFAPDGTFLRRFGRPGDALGDFHRPKGIALDSAGHVYVADAAFNNFQIFDDQARLLLFVGQIGRGPGEFWLPAGLHIDRRDRVYVVDQVNRRVQIFEYLKAAPTTTGKSTDLGTGASTVGALSPALRAARSLRRDR